MLNNDTGNMMINIAAMVVNASVVAGIAITGYTGYTTEKEYIQAEKDKPQVECLAKNIYFEAGNQSDLGKEAVAWVTLNRVDSKSYPKNICGVVTQARKDSNGNPIRHKCQFSWYCDGKSDAIPTNVIEQKIWEKSQVIAQRVFYEWKNGYNDPVDGATHYHADYVNPYWAASLDKVVKIDDHIFYR